MEKIIDLNYFKFFLGYALMLIPIFILWYYKTGLVKDTIIGVIRMTIQLLLVGVYLQYIFDLNNVYINLLWVILMSIISSTTIIRRSGLKLKLFFVPVFISGLISIAITDAYFLGFIIAMENIFDARYFIPITGMLFGKNISNVILSLNAYYHRINDEQNLYQWYLANGATRNEALLPFMKHALQTAFNPLIATTAIMGLISIPGMLTGQLLGGSDPSTAVKYQIMLMITVFASSILNVVITILLSNRKAFDTFDNLKKSIFKEA